MRIDTRSYNVSAEFTERLQFLQSSELFFHIYLYVHTYTVGMYNIHKEHV